jgi:hypothetical protein
MVATMPALPSTRLPAGMAMVPVGWRLVPAADLSDLERAVDFYQKVKAATKDERIAVGQDHFNWLKRAAFTLAAAPRDTPTTSGEGE